MNLRLLLAALLVATASFAFAADAPAPPPIDWNRAQDLYRRERGGEKLAPEDQAYLDRAKAERQKGGGQAGRPVAPAAPPPVREFTGMVPLWSKAGGEYKGLKLGLYGDNQNEPPAGHLKRAMEAAAKIAPLDDNGQPSPDGRIGLMSIGMSNTTQEFSRFVQIAKEDKERNPKLVLVDAAQGGQAALEWINDKSQRVWDTAEARLKSAGVTDQQVQVIFIKQARIAPANLGEFPKHAKVLQENIRDIITLSQKRYPNLRLIYLTSRTYAGYAKSGLNPEPYAYESGFSVQWLIQSQIKGEEPALAYDKAPVLLWGPYIWTDGTKGRDQDKVVWGLEDTAPDGTHPSNSGRQKVAEQLLSFFKTDATSKPWYVGK